MLDTKWYAKALRENLPGALDLPASPRAVRGIVQVAHAMANAGLSMKRNAGHLSSLHGLSTEDLAYDCIAELFQRGASDELIQLRTYFAGVDIEMMETEHLLVLFRRLVLGKVSNGVFRLYNEIDPVLGRILRNIKLGIASLKNFDELERLGEPCVVPALCDHLNHLPPADHSQLVEGLSETISGSTHIPDLLTSLSIYLRGQSAHSRVVPLLQIGIAFREILSLGKPMEEPCVQLEDPGVESDAEHAIRRASRAIQREYERLYVESKGIQRSTWEMYFTVIETSLLKKFHRDDGSPFSLFQGMAKRIPDLSKLEYQRSHRSRIEHLHHLVEGRLLRSLGRN
jgi:hypothetical protein